MADRGHADTAAGDEAVDDHPRAEAGLPRAGRALDGQIRVIRPRRRQPEQVADRPVPPVTLDACCGNRFRDPPDRVMKRTLVDGSRWDQGVGMRDLRPLATPEDDPARDIVHLVDLAGGPLRPRVVRGHTDRELVVLRREPVPVQH